RRPGRRHPIVDDLVLFVSCCSLPSMSAAGARDPSVREHLVGAGQVASRALPGAADASLVVLGQVVRDTREAVTLASVPDRLDVLAGGPGTDHRAGGPVRVLNTPRAPAAGAIDPGPEQHFSLRPAP